MRTDPRFLVSASPTTAFQITDLFPCSGADLEYDSPW
jgi:hypothetical protein